MAAALLTQHPVYIARAPHLSDVSNMQEILRSIGCRTWWQEDTLAMDCSNANKAVMPEHLCRELRSSIFLLGPILSRFGEAVFSYPGGCEIGMRPIDLHLSALQSLGADVRLGTEATVEEIAALAPDAVVLATGSRAIIPTSVPGVDGENVYTIDQAVAELKRLKGGNN